jgi:hypothetical protein
MGAPTINLVGAFFTSKRNMTMIPIRFAIDDDLWQSFTVEQVTKQIRRLRETGRFWSPNHGSPFVVRVSQYALMGGNPTDVA